MPSTEIAWPSEADLKIAEHPEFALLCRILVGLRRRSGSDEPPAPPVAAITRATHKLVDVLLAVEARIAVLRTQLTDGTATPEERRAFAELAEQAVGLLHALADDIDAGIAAAPRHLRHTEGEIPCPNPSTTRH